MMKLFAGKKNSANKGTTLIEMVMCFALMAIFVTSAAAIIASVTNLYYQVKGETYGRQVSDIIIQRVVSELEGAKWTSGGGSDNPTINSAMTSIELYNRSDTRATITCKDKQLLVQYAAFSNDDMKKDETNWRFDEKVYFNYEIEELLFVPGSSLGASATSSVKTTLQKYGLTAESLNYDSNIVLILMTINSDKYGTYRTVRPVKMYNVPEDYTW